MDLYKSFPLHSLSNIPTFYKSLPSIHSILMIVFFMVYSLVNSVTMFFIETTGKGGKGPGWRFL